MTQPAPTPTPTTGFDGFLGNTSSQSSSGPLNQSFPSSFTGGSLPGVSDKTANLVVPGTASSQLDVGTEMAPGTTKRLGDYNTISSGNSVAQMLLTLMQQSQQNPDQIAELQDSLILGGYLDPRSSSYTPGGVVQPGDATWDAYVHLLMDSVHLDTPFSDLLNQKVASQDGEKKFNLSSTTTQTNYTNPQDARLSLAQVMEQDLGRKPTNAEIAQFASQLAGSESANPTTTTTTYDLNSMLNSAPGGAKRGPSETTSGGVNANVEAQNFDMQHNGQEMASTDADRVYQTFLSMLGGAGSVT